jgi:type I restriction enzyme S subunit
MVTDWRHSTWGEEISLEYGKSLRDYDTSKGKYRVFGSNGPIGWTDTFLTEGPGIILGRKGAYRGTQFSSNPFFVIDTAYFVQTKNPHDMRWLYYAIKHHKLGEIDDGSPIPSTTRSAVYVCELDVPSLPEQRAIAHVLGSLDDKIELNRQMNETLEEMARTLFRSWFVDFDPVRAKSEGRQPQGMDAETAALFPSEFVESELGMIPKGWEIKPLDEAFTITMGQSPPGETYNSDGDGLPFYQGRADFGFRFPSRRIYCTEPTRFADAGDTLVSVRAPVGDANIAFERCAIGRGVAAIRHQSQSEAFTYYLICSLRETFDIFNGEGTVFGSISKKDFHGIKFISSSSKIIETFNQIASGFEKKIRSNTEETEMLQSLRESFLPKLISGEIRLPEDMIAEFGG